jgi:hypothetical protein
MYIAHAEIALKINTVYEYNIYIIRIFKCMHSSWLSIFQQCVNNDFNRF